MTVKDMIVARLKFGGFDGLFGPECACQITDLVPCSDDCSGCQPGYKVMCTPKCDETHEYFSGSWHIQAEKPKTPPHVLGCDDFHQHQAPGCCAPECWCVKLPEAQA